MRPVTKELLYVVGDFSTDPTTGSWCIANNTGPDVPDVPACMAWERRTRMTDPDGDGIYEARFEMPPLPHRSEGVSEGGQPWFTRWRVATPGWAMQEPHG